MLTHLLLELFYHCLELLTTQIQISLLAGQNFWETVPVPGKVPHIKVDSH